MLGLGVGIGFGVGLDNVHSHQLLHSTAQLEMLEVKYNANSQQAASLAPCCWRLSPHFDNHARIPAGALLNATRLLPVPVGSESGQSSAESGQ